MRGENYLGCGRQPVLVALLLWLSHLLNLELLRVLLAKDDPLGQAAHLDKVHHKVLVLLEEYIE